MASFAQSFVASFCAMQFAISANKERILPLPKGKAICPGCGAPVIAKCGEIVIWHWSHLTKDCDPWYEPESAWHRQWKEYFPESWREVVIGNHRADVKTPLGVIEFQASAISSITVQERENFYKKMIWVIKADAFDLERRLSPVANSFYLAEIHKSIGFCPQYPQFDLLGGGLMDLLSQREQFDKAYYDIEVKRKSWEVQASAIWDRSWMRDPMYKWRWPRTTWAFAKKKIYLDLGNELFGVTWMSPDCKMIKGLPLSKEKFIAKLLDR